MDIMKNNLKDSNAPKAPLNPPEGGRQKRIRGAPLVTVISIPIYREGEISPLKEISPIVEMTTPTWTATARGTPVVAKMQTVARMPVIPTIRHVMEKSLSRFIGKRTHSMEQISLPVNWDRNVDFGLSEEIPLNGNSASGPTGRDGPPGLAMISGVPAWLARGTKPLPTSRKCGTSSPKERGEERGRGMPWLARGTPIRVGRPKTEDRSRGKPDECVNAYPDSIPRTRDFIGTDRPRERAYRMRAPIAIGGVNEDGMIVILVRYSLSRTVGKERSVTFRADCNRFLSTLADGFGMTFARGKPPDARDRGHPPEAEYDAFHRAKLPGMGLVCATDLSAFAEPARLRYSGGPDNVKRKEPDNVEYQLKLNADRSVTLSGWRDADLTAFAAPDNVEGKGGLDYE